MSAWSPPNTGARNDARGYPIPSSYDPGRLPENAPKTFIILGTADGYSGQPFAVRDNASGSLLGWRGPSSDSET